LTELEENHVLGHSGLNAQPLRKKPLIKRFEILTDNPGAQSMSFFLNEHSSLLQNARESSPQKMKESPANIWGLPFSFNELFALKTPEKTDLAFPADFECRVETFVDCA
jgi:hypothetical protein